MVNAINVDTYDISMILDHKLMTENRRIFGRPPTFDSHVNGLFSPGSDWAVFAVSLDNFFFLLLRKATTAAWLPTRHSRNLGVASFETDTVRKKE